MKKKKKKKRNTIGATTNSRGTWGDISPVTRIKENKKKKNDRKKVKIELN